MSERPFVREYDRTVLTPEYLAAQTYAERDWPVFPLNPHTKKPFTKWRLGGAGERATTEPDQLHRWWSKWPQAGVGVITGAESGLFVLDVDGPEGRKSLAALEGKNSPLPLTLQSRTPRADGGVHHVFTSADGRNSVKSLGPGLDTRGEGGYFVAPPSMRSDGTAYTWVDAEAEPAPAPSWLLLLAGADSREHPASPAKSRRVHVSPAEYVATAFSDDLASVRAAENGSRNNTLNVAAYNAGRLTTTGHLAASEAVDRLLAAALAVGCSEGESRATIASGLASGQAKPLALTYEPTDSDDAAEVARRVQRLWVDERARRAFRAEVVAERLALGRRDRQMDGAEFVLDVPPASPVLWGIDGEALWVEGEGLLLVGSDGVGKTTVAQQLAFRRIGIKDQLLALPVEPAEGVVLYLAMDRPDQARRSFARMLPKEVREDYRGVLKERLAVWRGPVPVDVLSAPDALANWVGDTYGGDVTDVFVDSYKDLAAGLSDDAVGAGINSAMQEVLARGLNWLGIHHQRKANGGNPDPSELADVYGSRWLTAGVGSLLMFVGRAGDKTVELRHLKQPSQQVGPLLVQHDHSNGATRLVDQSCEPLDVLDAAGSEGCTARQVAEAVFGLGDDAARKRAERTLTRLAERGEVVKRRAKAGGLGGSEPARYWLKKHHDGGA